jgi:hypothetical protein
MERPNLEKIQITLEELGPVRKESEELKRAVADYLQ